MPPSRRHRYALAVPFVLLALVTLLGGAFLNILDARGRVVDDTSDDGVATATVTYGSRVVASGADGSYFLPRLPRGARLTATKLGYSRLTVAADVPEIRLSPLSVTFTVKDETTGQPIPQPEARQRERQLLKGGENGLLAVSPYPLRDAPVLICAPGHESKEVTPKGPTMEVLLKSGGAGCPPLPTPSPTPSASPTGAPSTAPSPSSSPAPSPSGIR